MKIKAAIISIGFLFLATVAKCGPNGAASVADSFLNHIVATAPNDPNAAVRNCVPENPWRALDGETNYIKLKGVEFCGKVVDVSKDGIRVEGKWGDLFTTSYYPSVAEYSDFYVANYPFTTINDQVIHPEGHEMAWYVGTYTYSTVNGGSRTIPKLDYGVPCDPPAELIRQQMEIARARAIEDKKKAAIGQTNAFHWLQSQATNGDASAQCSLGEHYLNGQGCETNQEQGIYWLQKAAALGDLQASKKLEQLKQQN